MSRLMGIPVTIEHSTKMVNGYGDVPITKATCKCGYATSVEGTSFESYKRVKRCIGAECPSRRGHYFGKAPRGMRRRVQ